MDRGSRSARPLTGRAGADRTRTGGRGHCGREPGRSRSSRSDGAQSPGSPTSYHRPTGAMAQLAAHLLCKQGVTGSSPVGSTTFSPSSPCSSTGPPLPTPCASPPGPLSPYALRRGSPFPCALLPAALLSPMPSSGGSPPICSLVRAVWSSSLWGAAVGGEAGSRAGDSAHRTGAARAARPGRLRSAGAAPLGRGGSARAGDAGDAGASTAPLSHPAESSRRIVRRADAVGVLLRGEPSYDQGAASPEPSRTGMWDGEPPTRRSPVDFDAPQAPDALWITLSGSWLGDASGLPRVRTACSHRL